MKALVKGILVALVVSAFAGSALAQGNDPLVAKSELKAGFRDQMLGAPRAELDGAKCEANKKG